MEIKKYFGEKIKEIRKSRDFSQELLAQRAKLHRTYISDVERGIKNISLENIEKIAQALGVEIQDLFRN